MKQWYILGQNYLRDRDLENYLLRLDIKFTLGAEVNAPEALVTRRAWPGHKNAILLTYTVLINESDLSAILLTIPDVIVLRPYKELRYKNLLRKYLHRLLNWV